MELIFCRISQLGIKPVFAAFAELLQGAGQETFIAKQSLREHNPLLFTFCGSAGVPMSSSTILKGNRSGS